MCFSGTGITVLLISGLCAERGRCTLCASLINNVRTMGPGPPEWATLTLTLSQRCSFSCHFPQRSDGGWDTPVRTGAHHRGFTEDYPMCIRSFCSLFPEERSSSAQRGPSSHHTFRTLRRKEASHPGETSSLKPRASSSSTAHPREHLRGRRRDQDVGEVYPGCGRGSIPGRMYTHHGTG